MLNTEVTTDKQSLAKRLSEESSEEELAKLSPKRWTTGNHQRVPTTFHQAEVEVKATLLNRELPTDQNSQEIMVHR